MAALTQDKLRQARGTAFADERVAIATSATLYIGSLASRVKASGRLKSSAALATERFAGVVVDLSGPNGVGTGVGTTAGTEYATIRYGNEQLVTIAAAIRTNTSLALNVFVSDDDSVGGTAVGTAAAQQPCGELVAFEASDKSTGWLAVKRSALAGNIAV